MALLPGDPRLRVRQEDSRKQAPLPPSRRSLSGVIPINSRKTAFLILPTYRPQVQTQELLLRKAREAAQRTPTPSSTQKAPNIRRLRRYNTKTGNNPPKLNNGPLLQDITTLDRAGQSRNINCRPK
jgi:hypothetical protein